MTFSSDFRVSFGIDYFRQRPSAWRSFRRAPRQQTTRSSCEISSCVSTRWSFKSPSKPPPDPTLPAGPIELLGQSTADHRTPFPFQREAWKALSALKAKNGERSGLIVLPTGAGKTYTMVHWLLQEMSTQSDLRVLWLADRQELINQAARTFIDLATIMPPGFVRRLRAMHSKGDSPSSLADRKLDVAVITRQSVLGSFEGLGKRRLKEFLLRPTIVVVDEAHHAVAPNYDRLLTEISRSADVMTVGLTATPWPAGYGAVKQLRKRFAAALAEVGVAELVADGTLARPIIHSVHTHVTVSLDDSERRQAAAGDLPPAVLRRLDQEGRNSLIVDGWVGSQDQWGKTLLFAVDIEHADALYKLFVERGAEVDVLHSKSPEGAAAVLQRFRAARGPSVLISVGMLTEGVDVPDARTAFLARPTSSPILMRQMVGRVLRGPAAGGEPTAHVVDLIDRWDDGIDLTSPLDLPDIPRPTPSSDNLPRLLDDQGNEIPLGVLTRTMAQYREWVLGRAAPIGLYRSTMTGFYQLESRSVPVFEHTVSAWQELIAATLTKQHLKSPIDLFGDLPIPRPTSHEVRSFVGYLEAHEIPPPFQEIRTTFDIRTIALELANADAMTAKQRRDWITEKHRGTLAQFAFPNLAGFTEAVEQELAVLMEEVDPLPLSRQPSRKRKLDEDPGRQLTPLRDKAVVRGRMLLANEADYVRRLKQVELPEVIWSQRVAISRWAYWSPKIKGGKKGETRIVVNSFLRVAPDQVSDDLIEFLLWHELCHHLTPGQGHDAEFRRLEAFWPDGHHLDFELDELAQYLPKHMN